MVQHVIPLINLLGTGFSFRIEYSIDNWVGFSRGKVSTVAVCSVLEERPRHCRNTDIVNNQPVIGDH